VPDGWWNDVPPLSDSNVRFQGLGPQPSLAKPAVLTHRPEEVCP
jgi:hypothetical protein